MAIEDRLAERWRKGLAPSQACMAKIQQQARRRWKRRLAARWLIEAMLRLWQAIAALWAPMMVHMLAQQAASQRRIQR